MNKEESATACADAARVMLGGGACVWWVLAKEGARWWVCAWAPAGRRFVVQVEDVAVLSVAQVKVAGQARDGGERTRRRAAGCRGWRQSRHSGLLGGCRPRWMGGNCRARNGSSGSS